MSEANVNGDASMKATKNPGKLNTSFWDTAFKEGDKDGGGGGAKPKPKKKKVKKKKSKMASMWENKFEEQKKKVESTAYKPPPKKKVIKPETTETATTGKLNTSFWDTAFKEGDKGGGGAKPKPKKKKVKKKKSKMASMWENKFEEQKKKVESTAYKPPPKKKVIKPETTETATTQPTEPESEQTTTNTESTDTNTNGDSSSSTTTTNGTNGSTTEDKPKPKPKPKGKVSALAGKIAFNPMAMRGGLPPSLRKKREEAKEKGVELPEQDFARPVIPSSARRKATKKNIIDITNEQINEELRQYLSTSFKFDEYMILSSDNLCAYLRDTADIDLSSTGDNKWELDILSSAIKEVFGDGANGSYGYALRAI
eukprot:CAMPEP_0201595060 /NCGR_PEP_ID=MMETSP0190_2-20130828/192186_1 /ASSEMBLY_ACC=CAM_ASM_000263 /TAXON_ID=37353 /ORGANISM="Rosalina sp." /LENGTH=368 /DNA_ID=CAMNT_0048054917 /DNA_START=23 /DNA_END=1129 /DNA_ORIENTATION=-